MSSLLTHRGAVYTWHCDHYGHMNNMWYSAKFDEAGWNLANALGFTRSHMASTKTGLATVEQVTTFKRELLAGDTVEVWSTVVEVRERVIRAFHALHCVETGEVCATCAITVVHMSLEARRAMPIPDLQRRMAEDLVDRVSEAA